MIGGVRTTRISLRPDLNWGRTGARPLLAERTQFPGPRCLVVLDGEIREMPRVAPYGARIVVGAGSALVTAVTSGKSLVVSSGATVEAPAESVMATP